MSGKTDDPGRALVPYLAPKAAPDARSEPDNPGALVLRSVLKSAVARPEPQGPFDTEADNPGAATLRSVLRAAQAYAPGPLLSITDLSVALRTNAGEIRPVESVTLAVERGQTVGLVGESGSGKTLTALALMGLLPRSALVRAWECTFAGLDLLTLRRHDYAALRGERMAMVFQEPMTALNPVLPIGEQVAEPLKIHRRVTHQEAMDQAIEMLARVGIGAPAERARAYPHELSGGMRQRVLIAMALITEPDLLIADEPTTALDVTVQRQIVELLVEMQREFGMGILFVSHNLDLVAEIAGAIAVMQGGRVVEIAPRDLLFDAPLHPHSRALIDAIPRIGRRGDDPSPRFPRLSDVTSGVGPEASLRRVGAGRFVLSTGAAS